MLYLHIGTGKAGSSTIQSFLNNYIEQLGPDYSLVETFGFGHCWKLAAASGTKLAKKYWVDQLGVFTEKEYERFRRKFWEEVTEEISAYPKLKYVASSEHIFAMYGDQIEEIKRLRDRLNNIFGEVKLIVYCRNQIAWAKSFYAQLVKGPSSVDFSFDYFVDNLQWHRNLWDYYKVISIWADVFGDKNLVVRVFDHNNFVNGDLISDFSFAVNAEEPDSARLEKNGYNNVSPKDLRIEWVRQANKLKHIPVFGNKLSYLAKKIIVSEFLSFIDKGRSFPEHRDKDILKMVSDSNEKFNQRFQRREESMLPVLK